MDWATFWAIFFHKRRYMVTLISLTCACSTNLRRRAEHGSPNRLEQGCHIFIGT
jgi:hypothetical protein